MLRTHQLLRSVVWFLALTVMQCTVSSLFAEGIKQDTPSEKYPNFMRAINSEEAKAVVQMLTGQASLEQNEFVPLFESGIYPFFTQSANLTNWKEWKTKTKLKFFSPAKSDNGGLELLNEVTLKKMVEYSMENYHPICRYQAMIFLGELNQSAAGQRVVPYAPALPELTKAVTNPKLPTAVRTAALLGIKRHAEAGLADQNFKKPLTDAMLTLVKTKEPVAGESPEGQNWLRVRAAEVAVLLGQKTPEVEEALKLFAAMEKVEATTAPVTTATPASTTTTPATPAVDDIFKTNSN